MIHCASVFLFPSGSLIPIFAFDPKLRLVDHKELCAFYDAPHIGVFRTVLLEHWVQKAVKQNIAAGHLLTTDRSLDKTYYVPAVC